MTVAPTDHATRYSTCGASNRGCGSFSQRNRYLEVEYCISNTQLTNCLLQQLHCPGRRVQGATSQIFHVSLESGYLCCSARRNAYACNRYVFTAEVNVLESFATVSSCGFQHRLEFYSQPNQNAPWEVVENETEWLIGHLNKAVYFL